MIFSRYKRLGDDPDAIPPPPFGMPEDQYSPMPDGSPDYGAPPSDQNLGTTGGTATGPAAQISQQPDPAPSMRADSMDAAKDIKPIAGPPQPPPGLNAPPMPEPMRPVDPTGGNPLPKLPGMGAPAAPQGLQGVPQNPADIASKSLTELDALKAPDAPGAPKHWYSKLGTAIVNASSISPEQKQGLLHPVYSAQNAQYQGKVAGLQNKINLAEKLENVRSLDDARTEKADTSEQNAITNAAKQGIVFAPPGQTPPGDLVPTINPMAGRKGSPYANAQAFHDPHFGQFMVTAEQAALANGGLSGQVGKWLPMAELTGLIKAGAEQGKPVKEQTVPVSPATAVAMNIKRPQNEDGTVDVPISSLNSYNTAQNKPEPAAKNLNPSDILLHPQDFAPDQVRKAQELFDKEHREPRTSETAGTTALDRETKQFGTKHEKAFADANSQLDKINDAAMMVRGNAMDQALGVPKVMTALISGAGSGVRITQAELSAIAHARGIMGDIEGTLRSWAGQGKLTPQQQQQLAGMLNDVKNRVVQKRQIANDALDAINGASDRGSIIAADKAARDQLMKMENPAGQQQQKAPDGGGKKIDPATAKKFYDMAGGDPAKARALAQQNHWAL